jgi:hypothetical protein
MYKLFIAVILFSLLGCNRKNRSITIDENTIAQGDIGNDSSYNGLIKFYEKGSNILLSEQYYLNNVQNGTTKDYYPNGILKDSLNYIGGEENGDAFFYDSKGNLQTKNYYYYGLRVGGSTIYSNNKPQDYLFYSFDNDLLFKLDYDSIGTNRIDDIKTGGFFFYNSAIASNSDGQEIFHYNVYMINPPRYKFEYSLVTTDSFFKENTEVKKLDSQRPWDSFSIGRKVDCDKYAIKLVIEDSINNHESIMFKRLKYY